MKPKMFLFSVLIIFLILLGYFFIGVPPEAEEIVFGVNFSQKHAQDLGLDWQKNYTALLSDLGVKDIKLITHWDLIEPERDEFHFNALDWQINEAGKNNAKIILVIGMKTGRWPECHIPEWAKGLDKKEQQERILNLIEKIVLRYQEESSISVWMIENEPFFPFGECPWKDRDFLKKEVDLVKSIDSGRQVLISASGEGSFWIEAARLGDLVGMTIYKKVWFGELGVSVSYPFPPVFYWRKSQVIKKIFNKKVICTELQAEPWCSKLLYYCPLEEQEKTMDLEQFRHNIDFAKRTGLDKFYLWGSEWWYQMKEKHNKPEIWQEAKKLWK